MKTTLIFLFITGYNLLVAQNIAFNFNEKAYNYSSFESIKQSKNDSEFLVSASQYKAIRPDKLQDGLAVKKGFRMVLSLHNTNAAIPLKDKDTLFLNLSNHQYYSQQRNAFDNQSKSEAYNSFKQTSNQLNTNLKSKEVELKALAEKATTGDKAAMQALEKLVNSQIEAVENATQNQTLEPTFNDSQSFYSLNLFIPYKDNTLEYELKVTSGHFTITAITNNKLTLYFKGQADLFYDDWDDKAKQNYIATNGNTTFSKILKETGTISGTIALEY